MATPFADDVRRFVETTTWRFARTYAATWPHEYHHEGGKVYWSMDATPESTTLVNRCDEDQTYEARLAAGTLPRSGRREG